MYDILQLNVMKVNELKEIAEQLNVSKFKTLSKQDLIYKVLDAQAIQKSSNEKEDAAPETDAQQESVKRKKRKRVNNPNKLFNKTDKTGEPTLPFEEKEEEVKEEPKAPIIPYKDRPKRVIHKIKDESAKVEEKEQVASNAETTDSNAGQPEENQAKPHIKKENRERKPNPAGQNQGQNTNQGQSQNNGAKRHYTFDVELDGIISGAGVLEIITEGYGFLRSSDYNYLP